MGNVFTNNSSISNGIWTSMGSNNIMNDEHSRLDKNHYTRCKKCLEDHMDFLEGLRQDEQDEVREMENACDE